MVAVVGGGAIIGSGINGAIQGNAAAQAGNKAANFDTQAYQQQISAGNQANSQDQAQYNTEQSNLNPLISVGNQAAGQLSGQLPSLTAQFTGANLQNTPGYQFTLQQGLEQAQNGFAARGLASSGAAIKGAENYATGLASSTYNTQLQNYLSQNNQIYNMLNGTASLGGQASQALGNASSVAQGGNALVSAAQGGAQSLGNAGTAAAAGITGSTTGNTAGLTNTNNLLQTAGMGGQGSYNNSMFPALGSAVSSMYGQVK